MAQSYSQILRSLLAVRTLCSRMQGAPSVQWDGPCAEPFSNHFPLQDSPQYPLHRILVSLTQLPLSHLRVGSLKFLLIQAIPFQVCFLEKLNHTSFRQNIRMYSFCIHVNKSEEQRLQVMVLNPNERIAAFINVRRWKWHVILCVWLSCVCLVSLSKGRKEEERGEKRSPWVS